MTTRVHTLTSPGFNDTGNVPYKGIAISCYLATPGGTPVKNLEGHLLFNGQKFGVGTTSDITTGAISLSAVYVGDLTQPDGSATTCQLVISGANQTIESPVAGYAYASSIDITTWLPSSSTSGTTLMFLGTDNTSNTALQNLGIAIDITVTAVKPDGRTLVGGQPTIAHTDSNGDIAVPLVPTSLLNPSTARYTIVLPGATWYFHVPVNPTGYQGAWSSGTTYHLNAGTFASPSDVVLSGGVLYQSILDGINHVPPNVTYWRVFAGEPIIWNLDSVAITGPVAVSTTGIAHDSNVPAWLDSPVASPGTLHDDLANLAAAAGLATVAKSATYTATEADDWIFVSGASSAWALTLMSVATRTRPLYVFLTNATHAVTVTHGASDTINGASTLVLNTLHQWCCLKPPASGTDWAALVAGAGSAGTAPTVLLDYLSSTDIATAVTLSTGSYTDIGTNQTFTVGNAGSTIGIFVGGVIGVIGTDEAAVQLTIDSAGTPITRTLCGTGSSGSSNNNFLAGAQPVYLTGLSAAAHTVKIGGKSNAGFMSVNCRSATIFCEFLRIQVVEFTP